MSKRLIDQQNSFTIYTTFINGDQLFITASITDKNAEIIPLTRQIYSRITEILSKTNTEIVHERLFGSNSVQAAVINTRKQVLKENGVNEDLPLTYIQGEPCWGPGFAGVQLRAIRLEPAAGDVWTIYDQGLPCGRGWKRNGATFLMLQNMHGWQTNQTTPNTREAQMNRMFERTNRVLQEQGASYRNVIRTWIYLSDILDWYTDFNKVRNLKYSQFNLIPNSTNNHVAEKIYLPASTGIRGDNPLGSAGVMDVFAVVPENDSPLQIDHTAGVKQRSPFRYKSAFSRAMSIREPDNTHIFVSGTAAIDEQGKSLYPGDTRAQILKTLEVVEALISQEGAALKDIIEATVFLKRAEDLPIYEQVIKKYNLTDMPAVCVVADVCREELLFELDAAVAIPSPLSLQTEEIADD